MVMERLDSIDKTLSKVRNSIGFITAYIEDQRREEEADHLFGEDPFDQADYSPRHATLPATDEPVIRAVLPGATRTRVEALDETGVTVEVPMDELDPFYQALIKESVKQATWFQVYRDSAAGPWKITADDTVLDAVRKSGISPAANRPDLTE